MNLTNSIILNKFVSLIRTIFIIFIFFFYKKFSSNSKYSWYILKIINNSYYRFLPINFIDKYFYKKILLKKNFLLKLFYKEGYQADKELKYFDFYYNKAELNLIYFSSILSTFKFYSHNNKAILHEYFIINLLKKIIFLFEKNINLKNEKFKQFVHLLKIFFSGNVLCVSDSNLKEINFYFNRLTILYDKYKYDFQISKIHDFEYNNKIKIGVLWYSDFFNKREFQLANVILEELKNNYSIHFITNVHSEELNLYTSQYKNIYFDLTNLEDSYLKIKNLNLDLCFLISPKSQNPFNNLSILLSRRLAKRYLILNSDIVTRGYNSKDIFFIFNDKNMQDQFIEKSIYLENYYINNVNLNFKEMHSNNNKDIDFFSSATTLKINYQLLLSWVNILKLCPNTNLFLAPFPSEVYKNNMLITLLSRLCSTLNVNLNRIKILNINSTLEINKYLSRSKIYLDSYPYTASATIVDVVSLNIPLITRTGNLYRSSLSALALKNLKKTSSNSIYFDNYVKIVNSYKEYEIEAVKLFKIINSSKHDNNIFINSIKEKKNNQISSNINEIIKNLT